MGIWEYILHSHITIHHRAYQAPKLALGCQTILLGRLLCSGDFAVRHVRTSSEFIFPICSYTWYLHTRGPVNRTWLIESTARSFASAQQKQNCPRAIGLWNDPAEFFVCIVIGETIGYICGAATNCCSIYILHTIQSALDLGNNASSRTPRQKKIISFLKENRNANDAFET